MRCHGPASASPAGRHMRLLASPYRNHPGRSVSPICYRLDISLTMFLQAGGRALAANWGCRPAGHLSTCPRLTPPLLEAAQAAQAAGQVVRFH